MSKDRKLKCSKCGGIHLYVSEVMRSEMIYEQLPNGQLDSEGCYGTEPEPVGVLGAQCCSCGHSWRIKNAKCITDIYPSFLESILENR